MTKITFIIQEFLRNFRKNLFKNILLMVMFTISFIMTAIMCSYYLDLHERYGDTYIDDSRYYNLAYSDDSEELFDSCDTVSGCLNAINYCRKIQENEDYNIIAEDVDQPNIIRENDARNFFKDKDYTNFLDRNNPKPFSGYFGTDETGVMLELKACELNLNAYNLFGLKIEKGECFTKENLTIKSPSDNIPIIVGNEYTGIFDIGDRIEMSAAGYIFPCQVIGILKKGETIPDVEQSSGGRNLDYYIIYPFGINISEISGDTYDVKEFEKYVFWNWLEMLCSHIKEQKNKSLHDLIYELQDTAKEFGVPAVTISGTSLGMYLLRKESADSVRIILILTVILMLYTLYNVFVIFYDKIQDNMRTYGIYMMNGCSLKMILISYFIEITCILLPSLLCSNYLFSREDLWGGAPELVLRLAYYMIAGIFVIGILYIVFLLKSVDTEYLIKQKE